MYQREFSGRETRCKYLHGRGILSGFSRDVRTGRCIEAGLSVLSTTGKLGRNVYLGVYREVLRPFWVRDKGAGSCMGGRGEKDYVGGGEGAGARGGREGRRGGVWVCLEVNWHIDRVLRVSHGRNLDTRKVPTQMLSQVRSKTSGSFIDV